MTNKRHQENIWTGRIKILLSANGIIVYTNDPENSTKELLQVINNIIEVVSHKINSKISVDLILQMISRLRKKIR